MSNSKVKNLRIRRQAKEHNVRLWEIADELEMTPSQLSVMLRKELPEEMEQKVLNAIEKISAAV